MAQTTTRPQAIVQRSEHKGMLLHTNPDGTKVEVPGTTVIHGDHVTIDPGVKFGHFVQLSGEVHLLAGSDVGNWCRIDGSTIENSRLGDHTIAERSIVRDSQISGFNWIRSDTDANGLKTGKNVTVGPTVIVEDLEIPENEWYQG